jgi:hypothetical protein
MSDPDRTLRVTSMGDDWVSPSLSVRASECGPLLQALMKSPEITYLSVADAADVLTPILEIRRAR